MAHRYIVLDYMVYDTVHVPAGGSVQVFSERNELQLEAAVSLAEPELVDRLLAIPQVRAFLMTNWNLDPRAFYKTRVVRPFLEDRHRKPGDIDVLAVERQKPHEAVVSEWKRVKVRSGSSHLDQRVNGLDGATDGVLQVNELAKKGFSRTWLSLLVIADGRDRTDVNMAFRGPTGRTVGRIYDVAQCFTVNPGVGICVVESVQTTHCGIATCGALGFGVLRFPQPRIQSNDLTSRIANFIEDQR